ncbi:hypothetical protein P0L94_10430 [Microbacter sp. GSS18]|nr:hypothetical protein P0L94_10430 [Microbacter sp. GSS18]
MRGRTRGIAATAAALVALGLCAASAPAIGAEPGGGTADAAPSRAIGAQPATSAGGALPARVIESSGPLTLIDITPDLACTVQHIDDALPVLSERAGCGTLAARGERVYGPRGILEGSLGQNYTPWDPQGDQGFSGSGTPDDPYAITSQTDVGFIRVTQIDSYVVGEESYTTDIIVTGLEDEEFGVETTIYHAGNCQVGGSLEGLGSYSPDTGAVSCLAANDAGTIEAGGRVLQFVPLTPGSNYLYGSADRVWGAISTRRPLPDSVLSADAVTTNAIALSWTFLASPDPTVLSLRTALARTEAQELPTQIFLSTDAATVGDDVQVTAVIENPNGFRQEIDPLIVTLPPGVSYVEGTASPIGEPTITGSRLDFGTVTLAPDTPFEFVFAVNATSAGRGAIELSGVTSSGAPVRPAVGGITVRDAPRPPIEPTDRGGGGEIDPRLVAWGAGGAVLLIIVAVATIAAIRAPRRLQKKLVREHVRLMPRQATTIHNRSTPDVPAPTPPSFHLAGKPGEWEHRVIEEEP